MAGWLGEFLNKVLPTTWMRLTAAMTATSTLGGLFLYEGLQKIGLKIEYLASTEVRLLLGVSALCIGLVALLSLSLVHIHEIKNAKPKKRERVHAPIPQLDEAARSILTLVGNKADKYTDEIAAELKLNSALTLHRLEQLQGCGLTDCSYSALGAHWRATTAGREYMAQHDLFVSPPPQPKQRSRFY